MQSKTASAFTKSSSAVYLQIPIYEEYSFYFLIDYELTNHQVMIRCVSETTHPLFVTIQVIPAAFAAASPIALSSTTTHLHIQIEPHSSEDLFL